jgi:hypothetical protein
MRRRYNLASPPTYDQRFVSLFLNQLELCGSPHYPDGRWHRALHRADVEYQDLRPLKPLPAGRGTGHNTLPPQVAGVRENPQQLYANYGAYCVEGVLKSVDQACPRWLRSH